MNLHVAARIMGEEQARAWIFPRPETKAPEGA